MNLLMKILVALCLIFYSLPAPSASAASKDEFPMVHFKGIVKYITYDATYGILGEDGKKYQPIRLSKDLKKDGLVVIVDAKIRNDLIGARMWGTAIEIIKISDATHFISLAEQQAMQMLLARMEAYNAKDLVKLQTMDTAARALSQEQFDTWVSSYAKFTLRYLEVAYADTTSIEGICLYSRDLVNGMALSGNTNYSLIKFTLCKLGDDWRFVNVTNYYPDTSIDLDQYIDELQEKSIQKYGTNDLASAKPRS